MTPKATDTEKRDTRESGCSCSLCLFDTYRCTYSTSFSKTEGGFCFAFGLWRASGRAALQPGLGPKRDGLANPPRQPCQLVDFCGLGYTCRVRENEARERARGTIESRDFSTLRFSRHMEWGADAVHSGGKRCCCPRLLGVGSQAHSRGGYESRENRTSLWCVPF